METWQQALAQQRNPLRVLFSEKLCIVRIELVQDFFVELMLAAKFPYPLPTMSLGVY